MQIQLARKKVRVLSGNDRGRYGHDARVECILQRGFELAVGMGFEGDRLAVELQLQRCVLDRAVVSEAVEIERDVLAVDHADQLKELRNGGESRQHRPGHGCRGVAVVVAFTGQGLGRDTRKDGGKAPRHQGKGSFHVRVPGVHSGRRPMACRSADTAAASSMRVRAT